MDIDNEGNAQQVTMRVRQRENVHSDGTMMGWPWYFGRVKSQNNDDYEAEAEAYASSRRAQDRPSSGKYVGQIEVIILRCGPKDRSSSLMPLFRVPAEVTSELQDSRYSSDELAGIGDSIDNMNTSQLNQLASEGLPRKYKNRAHIQFGGNGTRTYYPNGFIQMNEGMSKKAD
jgi:hypothetical protein